jgi:hypothetical protein
MGKKSTKAPDYTELANASREAIALGRELGTRQLDFAEQQYNEMRPLLTGIAESQIAAQDQQLAQAEDYYDYQVETFRPLERGLVADAQEFSTQSYRDRMAGDAAAAAGRAFSNTQEALSRSDAARGLNPNSPAARAARQQASLGLAAQRANAMTSADNRAEQMGWARRMDAAGLGRGLAGASAAAYQGSVGAGNAGAGTYQQPGQGYMAGMGQGAGTMMGGYQTGMRGLQGIVDSQTSVYNTGVNAQGEMYGALLGAGGNMMAAGMGSGGIFSDRRLKEGIEFSHVDQNSGLNIYTFRYKGAPNRKFMGVIADEVETRFPDAVAYGDDGYASVDYAYLGIPFKEITEVA